MRPTLRSIVFVVLLYQHPSQTKHKRVILHHIQLLLRNWLVIFCFHHLGVSGLFSFYFSNVCFFILFNLKMASFFILLFFTLLPLPLTPNNSLSCRPSEIVTGFAGWPWTSLLHSKVIEIPRCSDLKIPLDVKCYCAFVLCFLFLFLISGCMVVLLLSAHVHCLAQAWKQKHRK